MEESTNTEGKLQSAPSLQHYCTDLAVLCSKKKKKNRERERERKKEYDICNYARILMRLQLFLK
jgi:hypothetical protein